MKTRVLPSDGIPEHSIEQHVLDMIAAINSTRK